MVDFLHRVMSWRIPIISDIASLCLWHITYSKIMGFWATATREQKLWFTYPYRGDDPEEASDLMKKLVDELEEELAAEGNGHP